MRTKEVCTEYSKLVAGANCISDMKWFRKDWFEKLGYYDDGMEIWGGEQLELSFKVYLYTVSAQIFSRNPARNFWFNFFWGEKHLSLLNICGYWVKILTYDGFGGNEMIAL